MRILITGCAKSGTTLLFRLFNYFEDVSVLRNEDEDFIFSRDETRLKDLIDVIEVPSITVAKRNSETILSSDLPSTTLADQAKLIRTNDIKIVNIIRDGRDVILSDDNYVSSERWISCIQQRETFSDLISIEVRYEDLIYKPDKVQLYISKALGLDIKHKFSEYPKHLKKSLFIDHLDKIFYKARPISDVSIGKDLEAYKRICCSPSQRKIFEEKLKELDYVKP